MNIDFADDNVKLLIAGSLEMIVVLLTYIAFKENNSQKSSKK